MTLFVLILPLTSEQHLNKKTPLPDVMPGKGLSQMIESADEIQTLTNG